MPNVRQQIFSALQSQDSLNLDIRQCFCKIIADSNIIQIIFGDQGDLGRSQRMRLRPITSGITEWIKFCGIDGISAPFTGTIGSRTFDFQWIPFNYNFNVNGGNIVVITFIVFEYRALSWSIRARSSTVIKNHSVVIHVLRSTAETIGTLSRSLGRKRSGQVLPQYGCVNLSGSTYTGFWQLGRAQILLNL